MRLLRCIWSVDPALGGVQEAVRQACLGLPELGHSVQVVCLDEPDAPWLHGYPAIVHALGPPTRVLRGASLVPYGYSGRFIQWVRTHAKEYDAIIIEGLWQFHGLGTWIALRRSTVPYFVYPHSMLDPWFKHEYPVTHVKKLPYWLLAEYRILRDARAVLYTCEQERVLARQSFWPYQAKEAVTGLAIGVPIGDSNHQQQLFFDSFQELRDKRLIIFMGRIQHKKGCDLLIEAFARVSHADPSLHLVFVGPDQVGWQQELQRRTVKLGLESRVTWTGMLSGDAKWGALHAAEVFVLPSHSEGFPVAVVEALACGVPVLISNKVNIWQEVLEAGGGFVENDDLQGTIQLLKRWLRLRPDQRRRWARKAREAYKKEFSLHVSLQKFDSVLRGLVDHRVPANKSSAT